MSRFARKGTVSKGSGPIHLDSYALKGIPIRYTPPIFVPELILLPATWKHPVLPSRESFNYDYSVEKKVLEQAKNRAVSIAAEASLQMKEIERLRAATQLVESRDEESDEPTENSVPVPHPAPRPPIIPSSDILMPIPVAPVSSAGQSGSESDDTSQATLAGNVADGKNKTKTNENDALKSLGQMSIREFEGDASDPFEIASLQAINDMEILQTVLQPMTTPPTTVTAGGTVPPVAPPSTVSAHQAATATPVVQSATPSVHSAGAGLTHNTSSSSHLSQPVMSTRPSSSPQPNPSTITAVPPSMPVQVPQRTSSSPQVGVASGSSPSNPFLPTSGPAQTIPVNPFYQQPGPTSVATASPLTSTNPFLATSPPAVGPPPLGPTASTGPPPPTISPSSVGVSPLQAPGVGRLIDIVSSSSTPSLQQTSVSPSVPRPSVTPVPKPRTVPPAATSLPSTTATTAPVLTQQRNPVYPAVQQGRFGLGVPVLPRVPAPTPLSGPPLQLPPTSGGAAVQPLPPPPPYKVKPSPPTQHREGIAPPPYSVNGSSGQPSPHSHRPSPPASRSIASVPPPVVPRTYKLPDPTASLSAEQKKELKSISGMGFPSPRVARALLKCEGDKTKIFDFLFLVGRLEEQGYNGDSAETALLTCNEKPEEAIEYLRKVEGYKAMGFSEKAIHEAHSKSKGDWEQALEVLIQGR